MADHKLSDDELRNLLEQDAWSLHKEIGDLEKAVADEIRWHAEGHQDSAKTIERIQGHHGRISQLSFEMGKVDVHLTQVHQRLRERDQAQERTSATSGPDIVLSTSDHLDWLQPVIDSTYFEVQHQDNGEPELNR
jgi:hypothetical protein